MIITQKGGNYWTEAFTVPQTSISATSFITTDLTFERPGLFLGCSCVPDHVLGGISAAEMSWLMRNIDNSSITIGEFLTGIRHRMSNNNGSAIIMGFHILVYLKKRGSPA